MQAHGATHPLELHRADLAEGDGRPIRGVDDLLADQDLARPGVIRDPRGHVHRLPVVVTFLEDHGACVQTDMGGRQPGLGHARDHLEGGHYRRGRDP